MAKLPKIARSLPKGWPRLLLPSTVRGWIIGGAGLLLLILIVVVTSSAWMQQEYRSHTAEMENHAATATLLQDAALDGMVATVLLQHYIASGDETVLPTIRSLAAKAMNSLEKARAQEETRGEDEEVAALDGSIARAAYLSEASDQAIALRQSGDVAGAAAVMQAVVPLVQQFALDPEGVAEHESQEVILHKSRADRAGDLAFRLLVTSGAIGGALGLAIAALMARSILRPLSSLRATALAVAGGDLETRVEPTGPRELASLGQALNQMADSLLDASKRRELETEREQALAELRESEERCRDLFENANDLIQSVAPDESLAYVNRAWRETLGYSEEEIPALSLFDIIHPESKAYCMETFQRVMAGEKLDHVEAMFLTKDGRTIWVEGSVSCRFEDGNPVATRSIFRDITERKRAEEALRESEERNRLIVETAYDAFISMDARGVITAWNSQAERTLGWPAAEAVGRDLAETIVPPQHREAHRGGLKHFLATGEGPMLNSSIEITACHRDGHELPVDLAVWAVGSGEARTFNAFLRDISERKRAEEQRKRLHAELEVKAVTDSLTGLYNHAHFYQRLTEEIERSKRHNGGFAVLMMDVDRFKQYNDSRGHRAGDEVLRLVADCIRKALRRSDLAFRYGGDEFTAILLQANGQRAEAVVRRIRRGFAKRLADLDDPIAAALGLSSGIACFPGDGSTVEGLVAKADAGMYAHKKSRRDQVAAVPAEAVASVQSVDGGAARQERGAKAASHAKDGGLA